MNVFAVKINTIDSTYAWLDRHFNTEQSWEPSLLQGDYAKSDFLFTGIELVLRIASSYAHF
ncbi:MAG: hypothetical protein WBD20_03960 [Pirellulaceae bacterium]